MKPNILIIDYLSSGHARTELKDILDGSFHVDTHVNGPSSGQNHPLTDEQDLAEVFFDRSPEMIILLCSSESTKPLQDEVERIRNASPEMPVIVFSQGATQEQIIDFLERGVNDFISEPFSASDVVPRVARWVRRDRQDRDMVLSLKATLGLTQIAGKSPVFMTEVNKIPLVADCTATVLITGETGTGKELFARAIHYLSRRSDKPFIPVNCGAIPADLMENELFGHERGAYTGAYTSQQGLVAEAGGGTLFLDEIDCVQSSAQIKLLRLLQEKEYRRLGSGQVRKADVRVIAATNADLNEEVARGRFRHDLFYRLNIIPLNLPSLRERKEDIPLLARHFLMKYDTDSAQGPADFTPGALQRLMLYDWPGNVRELENIVERAVILSKNRMIEEAEVTLPSSAHYACNDSFQEAKARIVCEFERDYIRGLLIAHRGNISRAAKAAQKNRRAFWELMRKHNIDAQDITQPYHH